MIVLATVASTIWNSREAIAVGRRAEDATTIVTIITAMRKPGRVAHAANGMMAHSRYHGCYHRKQQHRAAQRHPEPANRIAGRPRNTANQQPAHPAQR